MNEHAKPCGWTVVSLRPQGQHAALRAAVAHSGGRVIALSPWRLARRNDTEGAAALSAALDASAVIFTSPAAVEAAATYSDLFLNAPRRPWLGVGEGTLRALKRHGIGHATAPARMDSEGLLALPAFADVADKPIGLVTAPGGRGLIAAHLQAGGARLVRADVYQRLPLRVSVRALARLSSSAHPWVVAVSSGEALERVWAQLSPAWQARWRSDAAVVVASERLAVQARALGLDRCTLAEGPTVRQMADAAMRAAAASGAPVEPASAG